MDGYVDNLLIFWINNWSVRQLANEDQCNSQAVGGKSR